MTLPDHRNGVFARIREALKVKAPHRHRPLTDPASAYLDDHTTHSTGSIRSWLPSVGSTTKEQLELFAKNASQLQAVFLPVNDRQEALVHLKAIAAEDQWKMVATHDHPLTDPLVKELSLKILLIQSGYDKRDLEQCDAAITGCDALVAQTGSVLLSATSAGGRALSVLPPHHVVIATSSQVVPDLTAALESVRDRYAPHWPSFLSFVTGPSRTGDIERILVLGAHGPKKLTILLLP